MATKYFLGNQRFRVSDILWTIHAVGCNDGEMAISTKTFVLTVLAHKISYKEEGIPCKHVIVAEKSIFN